MTVTADAPATEDPALAHLCACGTPREGHAGRHHAGRCLDDDCGCPRFRRDPAELAAEAAREPLDQAMLRWDARRARSNKTARARRAGRFGVGPSDIGECRKRIQFRERPPDDLVVVPADKRTATMGTWLHEGFTALQRSLYPWRMVKPRVLVPGFDEPGEVDSYDPVLGRVIDLKTKGDYGWERVGVFGPDDDDLDQTMLYGLALEEAGLAVREVEIVYLWRKTGDAEHFVRPYDRARALRAAAWLHGVLDSLDAGVELPRDGKGPGVDPLCDRCPFRVTCWQLDAAAAAGRSPQGFVLAHDEPEIAAALTEYVAQRRVASEAGKVKDEIRTYFDGLEPGRYGDVELAWQRATETPVPDVEAWARVVEGELFAAAQEGRPPRFPEELPHPTKVKRTGGGIIVRPVRAAVLEAEERARARLAPFYRSDGSWSCTEDHRTAPCGECGACRQVAAENAALEAS